MAERASSLAERANRILVGMSGAPTVSAKTIRAALLVARSAGLDLPVLLARQRIAPDQLDDPDGRVRRSSSRSS
jgi:hypothetical protein